MIEKDDETLNFMKNQEENLLNKCECFEEGIATGTTYFKS